MENTSIPYIAFETELSRMERVHKRLIIALIIAIIGIIISNGIWLYSWCQYDYSSEVVEVESRDGGNANYIGKTGDINNG